MSVPKYFTVIAWQSELATREHYLDLLEGDVLIVTRWNKQGWWWGVSAFDPSRSGWFKSTLTQPFIGELPAEAQVVIDQLDSGEKKPEVAVVEPPVPAAPVEGPAPDYGQRVAINAQGASTVGASFKGQSVEEEYYDEVRWQAERNKRVKR